MVVILSVIALIVLRIALKTNKKKDMYTRTRTTNVPDTNWRQNERVWRQTYIKSINSPVKEMSNQNNLVEKLL